MYFLIPTKMVNKENLESNMHFLIPTKMTDDMYVLRNKVSTCKYSTYFSIVYLKEIFFVKGWLTWCLNTTPTPTNAYNKYEETIFILTIPFTTSHTLLKPIIQLDSSNVEKNISSSHGICTYILFTAIF